MSEFFELVKSRRSVRTFDGNRPDGAVIDDLKAFSETIQNPYGSKVRFEFLDADEFGLSSPVLSGEKLYVSAVMHKGEHAEEAYGYTFQALLMQAHKMGLGTVWIGGTMPRDKFEKASGLVTNEVMPCVSPLGMVSRKMSVKETLMRKGVKADNRMEFEEIFFSEDFGTPLSKGAAMEAGLYDALECIRFAPSAVNKQPWRVVLSNNTAHFYLKHDIGFTTADYDLQKIDIGIAMYNFEKELLEEGKNPKLELDTPKIKSPSKFEYIASYRW